MHARTIAAKERELLDWLSDQQHRTEALVAKLVNIDSGTGDVAGVSRVGAPPFVDDLPALRGRAACV